MGKKLDRKVAKLITPEPTKEKHEGWFLQSYSWTEGSPPTPWFYSTSLGFAMDLFDKMKEGEVTLGWSLRYQKWTCGVAIDGIFNYFYNKRKEKAICRAFITWKSQ